MNLIRYINTLRYLRPVQVYGRLWSRFDPRKPDIHTGFVVSPRAGQWVPPVAHAASMLDAKTFRFLNVQGEAGSRRDWNDPGRDKLWLYNLHYFNDLNAAGAKERSQWHRALIGRWVAENPPGTGNGWEPYPASLRVVNWIKWELAGNSLAPEWAQSLGIQARWLRRRIERHLPGNHLIANAKALVLAGLFFEGEEASRWLEKGLSILGKELPEQVLADGGHVERSPMYHAIVLEDVLDLLNAAGAWPGRVPDSRVSEWRGTASRMLSWLKGLSHPDGRIGFFNDAAFGIAADHAVLEAYAKRLDVALRGGVRDPGMTHFPDSGYVRLSLGGAVALLDVADVGPDYLPGHAHADTLSFELSLFGQRVVVNSGTSLYGSGRERLRQRGTVSHSTVQVDGEDSSEVWGGFRVARRARPFGLELGEADGFMTAACSHDGYRRLAGRPAPTRSWRLGNNSLRVRDSIGGKFREAAARYYFHPEVGVTIEGSGGLLRLREGRLARWSAAGGSARIVNSSWYPEFGLAIPNLCLEVLFDGPEAALELAWD